MDSEQRVVDQFGQELQIGDVVRHLDQHDYLKAYQVAKVIRLSPSYRQSNEPNTLLRHPKVGVYWRNSRNMIKLSPEDAMLWKLENV